jgi:xeroderma pigmentosum group C-complementing protein
MPPFVSRKRSLSPAPPPPKRLARTSFEAIEVCESSDESPLSDLPSSENEDFGNKELEEVEKRNQEEDYDDDGDGEDSEEAVDWEDAIAASAPTSHEPPGDDLELTLDKTAVHLSDLLDGKKTPSRIEREIRINTHRLHVQCLLFHNALRNAWINDPEIHAILLRQLPAGIQKEIQIWRSSSALEPLSQPPSKPSHDKKGRRQARSDRTWNNEAYKTEPDQPDMSHGDPLISLLRVLAAYWKKNFCTTAPGLRKRGYCPISVLEEDTSALQRGDYDPARHGERIRSKEEFRTLAESHQGSRDVGAQLFTALLRALGIETRLVASLQPLGFGWTNAEVYQNSPVMIESSPVENSDGETGGSLTKNEYVSYDHDLPFPIYWVEVASPVTHRIIPVDPLVLSNSVATTPDLVAAFEPRGSRAVKAKQVIAYVIAYSADGTAKDVTTRYLRRRTWPGKTKGSRLPVEKIPVSQPRAMTRYIEYDWFRVTMRGYTRQIDQRTKVDEIENAQDLVPNQPERNAATREADTLQSLRASTEFALERFLRREEAIRPGAQHVRTFISGRGEKTREEKVFQRADVVKCLSAESWHKEGRQVVEGQVPLKRVPIRAVTLLRKRAVDELERQTGAKPLQGLYARHQTEVIVPPPIENGVIPKNEYGNIDCFVPSMVPQGAVHLPWSGTARICKRLGIDYAEAVTGFEFGSKMAVPVIEGVVIAEDNEGLLRDAWRVDQEARRQRERLQQEKRILQTWRKFLMGLRIAERVRAEYGEDGDVETMNPFAIQPSVRAEASTAVDHGGGFLLPGNDDDNATLVERPGTAAGIGESRAKGQKQQRSVRPREGVETASTNAPESVGRFLSSKNEDNSGSYDDEEDDYEED